MDGYGWIYVDMEVDYIHMYVYYTYACMCMYREVPPTICSVAYLLVPFDSCRLCRWHMFNVFPTAYLEHVRPPQGTH